MRRDGRFSQRWLHITNSKDLHRKFLVKLNVVNKAIRKIKILAVLTRYTVHTYIASNVANKWKSLLQNDYPVAMGSHPTVVIFIQGILFAFMPVVNFLSWNLVTLYI